MTRKQFLRLLALTLGGVSMPILAHEKTKRAPAFFVGHGSPMNALQDNAFTNSLATLGKFIPKPKAILVISAHWYVPYTALNTNEDNELMYDMYGFPNPLYDIEYPAKNADFLIPKVQNLLSDIHIEERSLDHGVWSVLLHLFPDADIPVIQLSINSTLSMQKHFDTGKMIRELRKHGIMIIGSGNITHNLRDISAKKDAPVAPWARDFDSFIKDSILHKDYDALIHYKDRHQYSQHAHPTPEHYIPLLYIAGSSYQDDNSNFMYEGFEHGSLSMRNWLLL